MNRAALVILVLALASVSLLMYQRLISNESVLKEPSGETSLFATSTRAVSITNGLKHSVPLEEIVSGGPPKDGIPSIDNPKFVSVKDAESWLKDDEPGIAYSDGDVHRFYPYQILVWHEIVNDTVNGKRILVTFCPLCLTGFVFDPIVNGERVEFGTSGKLWNSNLVMYDRRTDSLWSQILGEAIVGEMTGTKLSLLSSDQAMYGDWKKNFPSGEVLSRETGAARFYGTNPYGDYFSATTLALSLARPADMQLPNDALVLGLVVNGKAKAYSVEAVKVKREVIDTFEGTTFVLRHDKELDVVRVFKKTQRGEERVNPFSSFWFAWAAAHPGTELYK
ncbi:DUF3179 domain-containing protein [Candidatus Kaiserbacteria bacterium]|nr:DUF3179 domain-containing protein [Candidatus Kaiserbacteria bacterium]